MSLTCQVNNVEIDLIYSDKVKENIISINSKKELFFDVYECYVNDEKIILEKVADSELGPKVILEVNIDGKKYSAEATLVDNGSTYVELNTENIYFIRTIPEENIPIEESQIEEVIPDEEEVSTDNIEVNYENIIEHHVNNKLVFLHELEEQFEEKIDSLKDDISDKLDLFFEKLEDKKKIIIEEKLEKITAELNEKFTVLQSELHGVEDFSKKNIDNILENKIDEIDNSVGLFLESITKEYTNKIISSDKKITHNFLELNSIKEKLKENNNTANKKFEDLNLLKEKLLEQDELVLKNKELKKFINKEFDNIDSKFKNLSEEESKKYDELLAAFNNKDVVEYKTILKEKIQDVELTQIKESLQEEISSALKGDIVALKRYVEMSSGGGSVAKQFAAGGTMDGTLNVNGNILSGGINLIDIFNTDTSINLQDVTNIGNTTTNLISSNNTIIADTILATNLLSATNLDIGFELSGFSVTGDLSASGNISSGNLITPALSTNNTNAEFTGNVSGITQLMVGLANVCNTSDADKPVSTAQQSALNLKANIASPTFTGTVGGITKTMVGLANVCNTSDTSKPVSTAQQSALNLKANLTSPTFTDFVTVVGNLSASDNLSGANIVGNNVFSGGLAVCTSVPAQTIPSLQQVTTQGNTTTNSLSIGELSASKITGGTSNRAFGVNAAVVGGINNAASGNCSTIVGGLGNIASGIRSSIGNGYNSTASGNYSAIVSGRKAYAVGHYSFIGGSGYQNRAKCSNSFIGNGIYNCTNGYQASVVNGYYNHALGNNSSIVGGTRNQACASKSSVVGGIYNCAIGAYSSIVGGTTNKASGINSFIAGGSLNCINVGHNCSFIIGTGITSNAACTTFVNNLSSQGIVNGCSITSSEGVKVGGGSIISCTASFSPSLSDNGRTLLLDTSSGSIVVSVTPQISGYSARYIKEAGAAPVTFSTGANLSGLYSYQDRDQMSIIYAQADIFYKSESYAFLGGNLQ